MELHTTRAGTLDCEGVWLGVVDAPTESVCDREAACELVRVLDDVPDGEAPIERVCDGVSNCNGKRNNNQ